MAATIKIKNSSTAGAAPTASDLVQGELAVNVTDKRLYTENSGGTIVELGTNPSVPVTFPDGSASAPSLTNSGDTNTGMFFPAADTIAFAEGGTESMRLDSSGNLGLGVTPSAWGGGLKGFELNTGAFVAGESSAIDVGSNAYYNGTNWIYRANGYATKFSSYNGLYSWSTSASGTAGNTISFTQAMTLDASGNLLVGATSATYSAAGRGLVEINGSSTSLLALKTGGSAAGYVYHDGTEMSVVNTKAGSLQLTTNGSERARIDSSGNLLVGTTSTGNSNSKSFVANIASGFIVVNHLNGQGSGSGYASFGYNASEIGSITQNGTTAVAYNTTSDYRLKENVQPLSGALARVAALKPCTYTWKSAPDEIGEGFIAHELAEVCPQAVTGEKDAVNEDGSIKPQSIDTSFLVATLTAAIQELNAKFEAYKAAHP